MKIASIPKATHFRLTVGLTAVDFTTGLSEYEMQATPELPMGGILVEAIGYTLTLPTNTYPNILVAMGMEFYQAINANCMPSKRLPAMRWRSWLH